MGKVTSNFPKLVQWSKNLGTLLLVCAKFSLEAILSRASCSYVEESRGRITFYNKTFFEHEDFTISQPHPKMDIKDYYYFSTK